MTNKSLVGKAILFKGKQYVQVKDRVNFFNENYENGAIETKLLSEPTAEMVVIYAKVTPDANYPNRFFTGLSQASWTDKTSFVNATSAMENAETSAVGRALAMMGIGVIESMASADEVHKAVNSKPYMPAQTVQSAPVHVDFGSGETKTDKCEYCGSTNQYHAKDCPANPNGKEIKKMAVGESFGTDPI